MKKKEDLISVIIPVYNVEKYLDKCIESVISQEYKNLEIILVDDGSCDKCPQKCDEWAIKDKRIKVIHKSNSGLSDTRNVGIENSNGKYLCFIDSDDYVDSDMIQSLYEGIKKSNCKICSAGFIYEKENIQQKYYCKNYYVENSEQILKRIFNDDDFSTCICDKIYDCDLFDEIKFPSGKIHEDMGTLYKLIHDAKRIAHLPSAHYHYVQRNGSIINSAFNTEQLNLLYFKEDIMNFVSLNYPNIFKEAENFYIKQLNKFIVLCKRHNLIKEYKILKKELTKRLVKVILNFKISFRTKVKSCLIIIGGSCLLKK